MKTIWVVMIDECGDGQALVVGANRSMRKAMARVERAERQMREVDENPPVWLKTTANEWVLQNERREVPAGSIQRVRVGQ